MLISRDKHWFWPLSNPVSVALFEYTFSNESQVELDWIQTRQTTIQTWHFTVLFSSSLVLHVWHFFRDSSQAERQTMQTLQYNYDNNNNKSRSNFEIGWMPISIANEKHMTLRLNVCVYWLLLQNKATKLTLALVHLVAVCLRSWPRAHWKWFCCRQWKAKHSIETLFGAFLLLPICRSLALSSIPQYPENHVDTRYFKTVLMILRRAHFFIVRVLCRSTALALKFGLISNFFSSHSNCSQNRCSNVVNGINGKAKQPSDLSRMNCRVIAIILTFFFFFSWALSTSVCATLLLSPSRCVYFFLLLFFLVYQRR